MSMKIVGGSGLSVAEHSSRVTNALVAWSRCPSAANWGPAVDQVYLASWNGMQLCWPGHRGEVFEIIDVVSGRVLHDDELSNELVQADDFPWTVYEFRKAPVDLRSIARLDADPAVAWHGENQDIAATDASLGALNLTAPTVVRQVKYFPELIEDSANIEPILSNSLTQALASAIVQASTTVMRPGR